MRYAILSDIHSNWEALETTAAYLKKEKVFEYYILGDTIGYGANPNECFQWMMQNAHRLVAGNHEIAMIDPKILEWFNPEAREAAIWTSSVLKEEYREKIREFNFLQINLFSTMAHGSPDKPREFRYLFSFEDARESFHWFETPICFVGHTHIPALFMESNEEVQPLRPGRYELARNERYILNPGSVGQPRERDRRLAFGIFDDKKWTFEIVRLEYDSQTAANKIRKVGLPACYADQLL